MDSQPHNGLLWEKVAEMNLPERDLIDSFDSEEDFVNYMSRAPKIAWDSVKGSKLDKLKAASKDAQDAGEDDPKESKGFADIRNRLDQLEKK